MYRKSFILLGIITLLLLSITSGKILTIGTETHGLHVNSWDVTSIRQNTNYSFLWDVDIEGSLVKANLTNCSFFIHPSGVIGTFHQSRGTITSDGNGWYQTISSGNFSRLGQYDYQIDCFLMSNTSISGNFLGSFEVTPSGSIATISESTIIIATMFVILVLCLVFFFIGYNSEGNVSQLTFFTFSIIFFLIEILYTTIIAQQVLYGFFEILSGVESFWYIMKIGMTIGIVVFFVSVFMIMWKYWRIKRGMVDE